MATSRRPSYLKRQKEQQRVARANEKREARRERKANPKSDQFASLEDLGVEVGAGQPPLDDEDGDA